jgi:hypothetical protein
MAVGDGVRALDAAGLKPAQLRALGKQLGVDLPTSGSGSSRSGLQLSLAEHAAATGRVDEMKAALSGVTPPDGGFDATALAEKVTAAQWDDAELERLVDGLSASKVRQLGTALNTRLPEGGDAATLRRQLVEQVRKDRTRWVLRGTINPGAAERRKAERAAAAAADPMASLQSAASREEAMTHLDGMSLQQLKDFAAEHNLPVQVKTKDQAKRQIVELVTGSRLSGKALRDLGEGGQPLVRQASHVKPTGPASGASRLFSAGGYGRPVTGQATNAIQDADRALARGDSPADVAAGLRHQATVLRQSQLHESDVRDQLSRTPAELREIRNLEAERLREVADSLQREQALPAVPPALDLSVGAEPSWAIPAAPSLTPAKGTEPSPGRHGWGDSPPSTPAGAFLDGEEADPAYMPPPRSDHTVYPHPDTEVRTAIEDAWAKVANSRGIAKLADIRDQLGATYPWDQVNRVLRDMNTPGPESPGVLLPESNQQSLTQRDRDARINLGAQSKHLLALNEEPAARIRARRSATRESRAIAMWRAAGH